MEGDSSNTLYLIAEGKVKIAFMTDDGKEVLKQYWLREKFLVNFRCLVKRIEKNLLKPLKIIPFFAQ